ncbi:MAG TPA: nuclear transport factor 2 family protein [Acidimicrobiaceae bacterium]|jgi:3-phenylpropionate/cinnamic acid dioxygenase small subunit|nr:nuclear transport factor 2 family protein [Acidimicrobiaceae bacterium]|tara:strand:+ start:58 stop:510 length:453 start_codon:yes stop_codon:yes gene_type:complete
MQNLESNHMNSSHQIKHLLLEYARRIDNGDFVGIGELFSRGKIIIDDATHIEGSDNVSSMYTNTTRRYEDGTPRTHHVTTNIEIHIAGSSAESSSYFTVFQGMKDFPLQAIITGQYFDSFYLHDDGWWFKSRKIEIRQIGDVSHHLLIEI